MSDEKLKGVCPKCAHYDTCETPCILMHKELRNSPGVKWLREVTLPRANIIMVVPRGPEVHFSDLSPDRPEDKNPDLADPGPEAWPSISVTRKQTGIFVDRFFNHMSYEDIAVKWDLPVAEARVRFAEARARVLEIVRRMESDTHRVLIRSQKRSGRFSQKLRAFLLAKCFDLTITEVAQVLGVKVRDAGRDVRACADQIRAGKQIIVFEGEDLEARGANPIEIRNQRAAQA